MRPTCVSVLLFIVAVCATAGADCPLDHFIIGRNPDGVEGTADDATLFVDCHEKYRHSGQAEYEKWLYPLCESVFPSYPYRIGEPGFDVFQSVDPGERHTYDPNHALVGEPDLDYAVTVECIALSPGLQAVHKDYPQFTINSVGQSFNHSAIHNLRGEPHMHMSYQGQDGDKLSWMTFRVYDALEDGERYGASEPVTIVFNVEPAPGDLRVDGRVDAADLARLSHYWLRPASSRHNDYWERADANRDGVVNLVDLAHMAVNWQTGVRDSGD